MTNPNQDFTDFQIQEYDKIAEAHFKANDTISSFFRYYILLMSIPLTASVLIFARTEDLKVALESLKPFFQVIGIFFIVIAVVGLLMMIYVNHLRSDVTLYARTVNGVRRYFYDHSELSARQRKNYKVLPDDVNFFAGSSFLPVVMVFAFLNSFYLFTGIFILKKYIERPFPIPSAFLEINIFYYVGIFFVIHLIIFNALNFKRNYGYYYFCKPKVVLGVDIDGVLNKHREQFSSILYEQTQRTINPDSINKIPVHRCDGLNVSEEEEVNVFNYPDYWADMPPLEDAPRWIKRIKNSSNIKIWIFTSRPWPEQRNTSKKQFDILLRKWTKRLSELERLVNYWHLEHFFDHYETHNMLGAITRLWLKKHDFIFDKLIVEKTSSHFFDKKTETKNRLELARNKKQLKIFVEDDIGKAVRLCAFCELVFLFDQPYNQSIKDSINTQFEKEDFPKNLIRVYSWREISDVLGGYL